MRCDDSLRPFFYQYNTVSVLRDVVTLLPQIAHLTAIANAGGEALCRPGKHPALKVGLHCSSSEHQSLGWAAAQGSLSPCTQML